MQEAERYLPAGLPIPVPEADGVSAPYWDGLKQGKLLIQHCRYCGQWQFGPEWLCHGCHAFDPDWVEVAATGRIYSWERAWHPVHPALKDRGPYIAVLVELPQAGHVRMVGNLLGDAMQEVPIGAEVTGVFEHHPEAAPAYSLLQWQLR
ncbi:MAG: Zn-ribbon domain-containing OB-fold protein [Ramlibacter sp.]